MSTTENLPAQEKKIQIIKLEKVKILAMLKNASIIVRFNEMFNQKVLLIHTMMCKIIHLSQPNEFNLDN